MMFRSERMGWGEKHGYLQMGKSCQVAEGAFRNAGNVIAMESSAAEGQVGGLTLSKEVRAQQSLLVSQAGPVTFQCHSQPHC